MKTDGIEQMTAVLEAAAVAEIDLQEVFDAPVLPEAVPHPAMSLTGIPGRMIRLEGDWMQLLERLGELGRVTVQTWRHGSCAEQVGQYDRLLETSLRFCADGLSASEAAVDWDYGILLSFPDGHFAIRFYRENELAHQIIIPQEVDSALPWKLVEDFQSGQLVPAYAVAAANAPVMAGSPMRSMVLDRRSFAAAWSGLRTPDELDQLVASSGISRRAVFSMAGPAWATQVPARAFWERMRLLSDIHLPYLITLDNGRLRHAIGGQVSRVEFDGRTIRFRGEDFSFYLCYPEIDSVWVVTLSGAEDQASFLECHDAAGMPIAQIQSATGAVESAIWQDLVSTMPSLVA